MKKKKINWMKVAMLIAAFSMSSLFAHAQKIPTVQSYLAGLSATNQQALSSLMNDAQPTAAVTSNGISVFGSGSATVLDFKINDFSTINFSDPRLSNVQLIKIRLNSPTDFSNVLDLSSTAGLSQLSCIVLISSVSATTAQLNSVLLNVPTTVSTCYSISIPN